MNEMVAIRGVETQGPIRRTQRAKAHVRVRLVCCLAACDLLAILLGSALAGFIRFGSVLAPPALSFASAIIPLYLLSTAAMHGFSGLALTQRSTSVKLGVAGFLSAVTMLLMILFAVQQSEEVSRVQAGLGAVFTLMLIIAGRLFLVSYARRVLAGELYSIVRIDDLDQGIRIQGAGQSAPARLRWNIMADDPGGYHELAQIIGGADRAIVRCAPARRARWSHILQGMNVHAEIVASELNETTILGIGRIDNDLTFVVASGPLGLADRLVKRIFDIGFAVGALLVLLPLLLLVGLAIKLDSRGPIFFRQPRIGRQNRLFHIYKFRSMRVEQSDAGGVRSTARDDDRITSVGRFIRKTSIDELPQLLNVLGGDMSIVGPRPHAVHSMAQNKLFWDIDPAYWHRHACKPGITGLAQVRGHRGATAREQDLRNRLAADLEYLNQWSLWLDLSILVRTLGVVVHRNAF